MTSKGSCLVHHGKLDINRSPYRYSILRSKKKQKKSVINAFISLPRLRSNWWKVFQLFLCIATVGYIKFYGQNALSTKRSFNLSVSLFSVDLWSIKAGTGVKTNCSSDQASEKYHATRKTFARIRRLTTKLPKSISHLKTA